MERFPRQDCPKAGIEAFSRAPVEPQRQRRDQRRKPRPLLELVLENKTVERILVNAAALGLDTRNFGSDLAILLVGSSLDIVVVLAELVESAVLTQGSLL